MTLQKSILHHSFTLAEWGGSYSFSSSSFCLQGIESKLFFFSLLWRRELHYSDMLTTNCVRQTSLIKIYNPIIKYNNLKIIPLQNRNTNSQQSTTSFLLISLLFLTCFFVPVWTQKNKWRHSYSGQICSLYAATSNNILYLSCSQLLCLKPSALARKGYPV